MEKIRWRTRSNWLWARHWPLRRRRSLSKGAPWRPIRAVSRSEMPAVGEADSVPFFDEARGGSRSGYSRAVTPVAKCHTLR